MDSEFGDMLNSDGSSIFNSSWLPNITESRLQFLAQDIFNDTWDNITLLLSDWQKSQLADIDSESGISCLLRMWFNHEHSDFPNDKTHCNPIWDKIYCWPPTPAGTNITRPCSDTFKNSHPQYAMFLKGDAIRECLENGTWSRGIKTNYDICATSYETWANNAESNRSISHFVRHMVFVGSILSLLFLTVALGIFYRFKNLRTKRVTVHVHFMLALVLRFILLYVITEPFIFDRTTTYRDYDILCKSLMLAYLYSTAVSVMWMLVQGVYLNSKLTTNVLSGESKNRFRFYYFLGWVFPAVIVAVYLLVMILNHHPEKCWKGYSEMLEIWIILAPIISALALNGVFLLNILRVVMQKTQSPNSQSEKSKLVSVAKATLILFPVLGINNLLLVYNPGGDLDKYFVSLNTFFGSTQGIFVAIVYCFNSSEVHQAIRRWYNRYLVRRSIGIMIRDNQRRSFAMTTASEMSPQHEQVPDEIVVAQQDV